MCFFFLKNQADQILAVQNLLILNYQNESKVRVVILCYVPGGCSKWYERGNLKGGFFHRCYLLLSTDASAVIGIKCIFFSSPLFNY